MYTLIHYRYCNLVYKIGDIDCVEWVRSVDDKGERRGKERRKGWDDGAWVGKRQSGRVAGSGSLEGVMWSEMPDSEPTGCARLTVARNVHVLAI